MAFIDIQDPTRRENIVKEYVRSRNAIRERNEESKVSNFIKEREIEETFRPLVTATEKLPDKIIDALEKDKTPLPLNFFTGKDYDKAFSIYESNGNLKLGNSRIDVDALNNIHIKGEQFQSTPGLWDLITQRNPQKFTEEDLANYKRIIEITDLINNPSHSKRSSHKLTKKYKFLVEHAGQGIVLPGNIKSLEERLQLVCAERAAGNIDATTPEIVGILDELLRRNHISKPEYNAVCKRLGC